VGRSIHQLLVATVAKAVTLPSPHEQARKVVLVGNIGEFSLAFHSPAMVSPCKRGA
jgi:hypothetical protein